MQRLILALILVATYNVTMATMRKKLHWSVVLYWALVGSYWFLKASESGV